MLMMECEEIARLGYGRCFDESVMDEYVADCAAYVNHLYE